MPLGESYSGVHDHVQMLSLNSDGTAAQQHPETFDDAGDADLAIRFLQQVATVSGSALTTLQANHAAVLADLQVSREKEITASRPILGTVIANLFVDRTRMASLHMTSTTFTNFAGFGDFGRGTYGADDFGMY